MLFPMYAYVAPNEMLLAGHEIPKVYNSNPFIDVFLIILGYYRNYYRRSLSFESFLVQWSDCAA